MRHKFWVLCSSCPPDFPGVILLARIRFHMSGMKDDHYRTRTQTPTKCSNTGLTVLLCASYPNHRQCQRALKKIDYCIGTAQVNFICCLQVTLRVAQNEAEGLIVSMGTEVVYRVHGVERPVTVTSRLGRGQSRRYGTAVSVRSVRWRDMGLSLWSAWFRSAAPTTICTTVSPDSRR